MKKKVLLDIPGRSHSYFREMVQCPPTGYEFVLSQTRWDKLISPAVRSDMIYFGLQRRVLSRIVPIHLLKAYLEGFLKTPPSETILTYSYGHLIFRPEPWVVELEWPHQLAGFNYNHLRRFKRLIERMLASPHCKRIICWCELGQESLLATLDCTSFLHKIEIVPHAVRPKLPKRPPKTDGRIKLLFVGSANLPGEFYLKGGHIALEAYTILRERFEKIEMLVRSDVPDEVRRRYEGIPGLRVVDQPLERTELDREFLSADIFLFPGHHTPFMVLLEAMSYQLPIVATDIYATREIVEDGVTGFLIHPAPGVPYYVADCLPTGYGDAQDRVFKAVIRETHRAMVDEMVQKVSLLIEHQGLRQAMGKRARWEVEHGKFSLARRNQRLKEIFDEATNTSNLGQSRA